MSDEAFYRLVACAAPPEGDCAKPFYKWKKTDISVGLIQRDPVFLGGKLKRAEASIVRALQHLNAVDMGLRLILIDGTPDITIHLLDIPRGQTITSSTAALLSGLTIANAITALDVEGSTIKGAAIGVSNTLTIRQYESVMLEEITQALGLITDIRNPHYTTRSILSQEADNSLKTLGAQDTMALQRHYPPD
ncbi:hypothetical protein [Sulfitobacter guttiformis]|nr:hypothetical protein [Sulfitobacter guttiformis]